MPPCVYMVINHLLYFQDRFGNLFFIFLQSFKLFVTVIVVIYMILKELLSQYEIENNLSHKEMAQLLNVSTSTYYRWPMDLAAVTGERFKNWLKENNVELISYRDLKG